MLQFRNEAEICTESGRLPRYLRRARCWWYCWKPSDRLICSVSILFPYLGKIQPLTALLFSDYVAHLDGFSKIPGGWLNGHYIQLAYQLADSVSGFTYSFGGTCIILFVMNLIPGLSLRATEEAEIHGIDDAEIGEFAVSRDPYLIGGLVAFADSIFSV